MFCERHVKLIHSRLVQFHRNTFLRYFKFVCYSTHSFALSVSQKDNWFSIEGKHCMDSIFIHIVAPYMYLYAYAIICNTSIEQV